MMSKRIPYTSYFKWNGKSSTIIRRKGFGKELNKFFAKTLYEYSYPYTPYDFYRQTGAHMANNVRITANNDRGLIIYQSKYAKYLHEGHYNFQKRAHPLATREWERAAWKYHKEAILYKLNEYREAIAE
jgi:hypothetical protein